MIKVNKENDITWEVGSENVFADLEFADANEKLVKAELAHKINLLIKEQGLKHKEAAALLETDQAKLSALSRGQLAIFSIERLVKYLNLLHQDVEVVIKETRKSSHHGTVRVFYAQG